jgi:AcrR family transcriptional regulator
MTESQGTTSASHGESRPIGREEVIDAAIHAAAELFAERNPSQVTVREIATRAGVSHALVHRYLGSKDDIFRAVIALDRKEAAEFWMRDHGMGRTTSTFEADLPPGRYLRTIMRASLEGVPMSAEDMRFPRADRMAQVMESGKIAELADTEPFDVRFLFSAVTAMAAGMAVAEPFFLVQAGLEDEDHEHVSSELNRLIVRIMAMGDVSGHPGA